MELLKLRPAAEIGAATDRINNALAKLKTDLVAMRNQDVKLMRQMIHINETIQKISKNRPRLPKTNKEQSSSFLAVPDTLLIRRQSDPYCVAGLSKRDSGSMESINGDCCSTAESCDSVSDSDGSSDSDCEEFYDRSMSNTLALPGLTRPRSMTHVPAANIEEFVNEENYEDILKTNIKLWKHAQAGDAQSEDDFSENHCGITIVIGDC